MKGPEKQSKTTERMNERGRRQEGNERRLDTSSMIQNVSRGVSGATKSFEREGMIASSTPDGQLRYESKGRRRKRLDEPNTINWNADQESRVEI